MQQIVDFILELDKLKGVTRKTRPLGLDRYENSAEHSWQIAMLASSLTHFAETAIDINRVIGMLLFNDIGEIDTGDTIFYVEEGLGERKAAEFAAVTRIFGMLPEPQRAKFMALWQEFENAETPNPVLHMPRTVPCLSCSIWPTRDKAGGKTASAMNAWCVVSLTDQGRLSCTVGLSGSPPRRRAPEGWFGAE